MTENTSTCSESYTCPECLAGRMKLTHVAYFTWLSKELITVPDFPAWVCDICGRRDYDPQAVSWLNILLNSGRRLPKPANNQKPVAPDQPPAQL